jgi:hypothetical protein
MQAVQVMGNYYTLVGTSDENQIDSKCLLLKNNKKGIAPRTQAHLAAPNTRATASQP